MSEPDGGAGAENDKQREHAPEAAPAEASAEPPKPEEPAEAAKAEPPAPEPPKVEAAKAEEPAAAEAPKAEERAAAETAKAEEPAAAEAAKPEEPAVEAAKVEEPAAEPPQPEEPPPPPAPSIASVEPDHGAISGGAQVIVTGEGFAEGCVVRIGDVEARAERTSATTLEVEVPAAAEKGLVELRVVNPDGQIAVYAEDFRYNPLPSIAGTEPTCMSSEGGGVLTILGADFVQGCAVRVDGALVPSSWAHAGRLEAVCNKHDPGAVDVAVENPDKGRVVLEQGLRFAAPPYIDEIDPASAVTTGGSEVALRGRGFEVGSTVILAGAPVEGATFVSETGFRFTTPPHRVPELVDLAVVNPSGLVHRRALGFSYTTAPPRVASVTPAEGPNTGGTEIVLRGQDFDAGASVFLCGIAAKVTFKSRESFSTSTPAVARDGLVDVRVVNPDDQAHALERAFRYLSPLPPPELREVSPARGMQLGGLKVALLGENFADGLTVRFGGVSATVRFLTGKEIEVLTPVFTGYGAIDVTVTNPDGISSVLEAAFTYEPRPAPEISGITPTSGPTTGGTRVLIEGKNFTRESVVHLGREYPKDLVFKSPGELQIVTAPRKQPGVVDLEVSVPGAPKAVMKNGFRYDTVPAPVITSVSPTAGTVGGGTEMTISGKNFVKETVVLVDGKAPRTVKLVDAKTLELKTPPGEAGKMVDVLVKNPDGKEAVQKRAFLYDPRYRG